jgi:hypothetical protein
MPGRRTRCDLDVSVRGRFRSVDHQRNSEPKFSVCFDVMLVGALRPENEPSSWTVKKSIFQWQEPASLSILGEEDVMCSELWPTPLFQQALHLDFDSTTSALTIDPFFSVRKFPELG